MFKVGVDVGGTFTDVLLVDTKSSSFFTSKVPSTPEDSSKGVLNGIKKACELANVDMADIEVITHGTTVATNAILTGRAQSWSCNNKRLRTGFCRLLRSYVPGGLGGWLYCQKTPPLAPLEYTIEAEERMGADVHVIQVLNEDALRKSLEGLKAKNIEALTICLINSFSNDAHEHRIREIAGMPDVGINFSEVIPELQEYERTITTVANSYVRPEVEKYISNLESEFNEKMNGASLSILRSDGGLATAFAANFPVNLLMSGPAGGWVERLALIM